MISVETAGEIDAPTLEPRAIRRHAVVVLWDDMTNGRRTRHFDAARRRVPQREVDPPTDGAATHYADRFYESDASLARIAADFLLEGFGHGSPAIVVATSSERSEIIRELTDRSIDPAALQASNDLVFLDAELMLSTFMVNGKPDARKFEDEMCRVLESACRGRSSRTVRIFGQMIDVLWQRGDQDAAVRLELLWNQFVRTESFSLFCGYAIGNFYKHAGIEETSRRRSQTIPDNHDGQANRVADVASEATRRHPRRRDGSRRR